MWAVPLSLAATDGIDFSFFSSSYLDVSVHQVVTNPPMNSLDANSGISGSSLVCQLPRAFRRLPRPSSPPDAKTSPVSPYQLDQMYPRLEISALQPNSSLVTLGPGSTISLSLARKLVHTVGAPE